ncbi:MAG: 1-deoxy-D-xylulose-5-phosphate reductoisomerase [Candidatus Eutrophobiaceae bacterium]
MKGICILGSTGSIGVSTLKVLALHPERYCVKSLAARSNVEEMLRQCLAWTPELAVMVEPSAARRLERALRDNGSKTQVVSGEQGLKAAVSVPGVDGVMAAIVGAAGLLPTLEAVRLGKRVLLANKEALVMSGDLFMQAVADGKAELLPIDSEHNALFQCLPHGYHAEPHRPGLGVESLTLTASGGPFLNASLAELDAVTPDQACKHPKWSMGRKISVDSATMMNKGLEVIEACHLYAMEQQQVQVVIHPQSIVHSMVSYSDGSVLAQLGNPDMRTPIAHALAWPERMVAGVPPLNITELARLDFLPLDDQVFPSLNLARAAFSAGGTAPASLNAANEVAVAAFLASQIRFPQIVESIDRFMQGISVEAAGDLQAVISADANARRQMQAILKESYC